jgi:hypothetical protein
MASGKRHGGRRPRRGRQGGAPCGARILHVADLLDAYMPCEARPANDDVAVPRPRRPMSRPTRPLGLRIVATPVETGVRSAP